MSVKYVVGFNEYENLVAVVFSRTLIHADVARYAFIKPVSAGFCSIINSKVVVNGKSESLNLKSEVRDAGIIAMSLEL